MEWTDKNGNPLKKGDVVEWGAGHKGTVVELLSFGIRVQGYGMRGLEEWSGSSSQVRKVSNSCVSSNPVVQNALKACNADEYVVRKSLSTNKWLLSKKAKSLSGGEDKVFGSEQEARDFAKKNGLKVVNAEVAKNARTDWNQEVYNITEKVKKLVAKAKAEGATGPNSFGEIFENCLKVLRGY